jgi:hypothetical protein
MAKFTEYALQAVGCFRHSVGCERTADGWKLTLRAAPVQPVLPSADLPSAEFFAAIAAQSVVLAERHVPRRYVGSTEVRPTLDARELVDEVLGNGFGMEDKGRGFTTYMR